MPFFSKDKVSVKPKKQKLIVLEAQFVEEITGMAITKMLDTKQAKDPYYETKIHKKQSNVQSNK